MKEKEYDICYKCGNWAEVYKREGEYNDPICKRCWWNRFYRVECDELGNISITHVEDNHDIPDLDRVHYLGECREVTLQGRPGDVFYVAVTRGNFGVLPGRWTYVLRAEEI